MKKVSKLQVLAWALAVVPVLLVAAVYARLPEKIPMSWDLGGEVRYDDKWQLWIIASMPLLFAVLFPLMPLLDPKRRNYGRFRGSYDAFQVVMMLFMIVIVSVCVIEGLRPGTVNVPMVICIFCSLLFVFLGNVMPKFRPNWYCGFKNPWTLSSETVWVRTHRVGGRMMFAAGLIGLAGAFIPNDYARFALLFVPLIAACIVPTVLSYLWFRREQNEL